MGYLLTVRRLGARRQGGAPHSAAVATFLIETEGEGMLQQQLPFWMLMHFFLHSCNTACSDPHKHHFMFIFTRIKLIKVFFLSEQFSNDWPLNVSICILMILKNEPLQTIENIKEIP